MEKFIKIKEKAYLKNLTSQVKAFIIESFHKSNKDNRRHKIPGLPQERSEN